MTDCIFCKIAKGEVPCHKIYEDNEVIVILDRSQLTLGHSMVIPKNHKRWLWHHEDEEYTKIMHTAKKIANAMRDSLKIDWVEMVVAGMGVQHTHVHILPRYDDDGHGEIPIPNTKTKEFKEEDMKKVVEEIKKSL
ncbi:MAG: HIT domain-containing protein [Nanoarchaeota archaeon]|nr:HIT domain-containing protein [Nanoarchaeota archaeon]MBU4124495.1 HIT domain-containing protein [Nanoarchaeota archaeon]